VTAALAGGRSVAKAGPFDRHAQRYEEWFETHGAAYRAELRAVRELLPRGGLGVEIGVGSGRFAAPLNVAHGVDPSPVMCSLARSRGVEVVLGTGESLPYASSRFDYALMVTTVCFLDDAQEAFLEAERVLVPGGVLVVGFVDKDSRLGRYYESRKGRSVFYGPATFYSTDDVVRLMRSAGFEDFSFRQTLFSMPWETNASEVVEVGHGAGGFVVVRGRVPAGRRKATC